MTTPTEDAPHTFCPYTAVNHGSMPLLPRHARLQSWLPQAHVTHVRPQHMFVRTPRDKHASSKGPTPPRINCQDTRYSNVSSSSHDTSLTTYTCTHHITLNLTTLPPAPSAAWGVVSSNLPRAFQQRQHELHVARTTYKTKGTFCSLGHPSQHTHDVVQHGRRSQSKVEVRHGYALHRLRVWNQVNPERGEGETRRKSRGGLGRGERETGGRPREQRLCVSGGLELRVLLSWKLSIKKAFIEARIGGNSEWWWISRDQLIVTKTGTYLYCYQLAFVAKTHTVTCGGYSRKRDLENYHLMATPAQTGVAKS
ncbi:unnamed protein product [Ectocarpus sp. 12 AP-2014]